MSRSPQGTPSGVLQPPTQVRKPRSRRQMDVTRADSACAPGADIVRIHPRRPHKSPDNTAAEALAEAKGADRPWCPRLGRGRLRPAQLCREP